MKILLCPDTLKGSLSSLEACRAMETGVRRVLPQANCTALPLADGGEGTIETLLRGAGGTAYTVQAEGPLGPLVPAVWALLPDGRAVVEMAQASGLNLVDERQATLASSYGTGQVLKAALDEGCRDVLIAIGGSATTDGGAGLLQALGARFLDRDGAGIGRGGAALEKLASIDLGGLEPRLSETRITVLCDVTNPLCGPRGAAFVYAPQKGASPEEVVLLDAALARYADIAELTTGRRCRNIEGAGAAGGMGFGLLCFLDAQLRRGIDAVLDAVGFAKKLEHADLVLTAEGALDQQTLSGKAIAGITQAAAAAGVPVIAFAGAVTLTAKEVRRLGLLAAIPLPDRPMAVAEAMEHAASLLASAVERALSLMTFDGRGDERRQVVER